jgi:hypothetical protein
MYATNVNKHMINTFEFVKEEEPDVSVKFDGNHVLCAGFC